MEVRGTSADLPNWQIIDQDAERAAARGIPAVLSIGAVGVSALLATSLIFTALVLPLPTDRPTPSASAFPPGANLAQRDPPVITGRTRALTEALNEWLVNPPAYALSVRRDWTIDTYGDEAYIGPGAGAAGIGVVISLDTRVPAPDCHIGTAASAGVLAGWIASHPGLDSGAARPVSVGGRRVLQFDKVTHRRLTGDGATTTGCPGIPVILVHESSGNRHSWHIGSEAAARIFLFDLFRDATVLGEHRTVVLAIFAPKASFAETVPRFMPIVESFMADVGR